MARRTKRKNKRGERVAPPTRVLDRSNAAECATEAGLPRDYWQACRLTEQGNHDAARQLYSKLEHSGAAGRLGALVRNDLAVLATLEGRYDEASQGWQQALELDQGCLMARLNRDLVQAGLDVVNYDDGEELRLLGAMSDRGSGSLERASRVQPIVIGVEARVGEKRRTYVRPKAPRRFWYFRTRT